MAYEDLRIDITDGGAVLTLDRATVLMRAEAD